MIDFFKRNAALATVYIANLLLSLHYYLIIYVNSSLLSKHFSNKELSLIYSIGAVVSFICILLAPRIIRKFGVYHFILSAITFEGIAVGGLIYANSPLITWAFFAIHQTAISTILLSLDVFLESITKEEGRTGNMRSLYLTISNTVLVIAPTLISFLVVDDNFSPVYTISALFIVPLLLTVISGLRDVPVEPPSHFKIWSSLQGLCRHRNIRFVTGAQLTLQTFYAWMVIFMPLYLHEIIGFEWSQIGIMFTIMLLPFIIFEIPIGRLADEKFGEQEFMTLGFIIISLSLFLVPLLSGPSFLLWTMVLFLTRVGASFVEISAESYFFKQVAGGDSDWISLFRSTHSLGYILAPLLASLSLWLFPFPFMFTALAVLVFFGVFCARSIIDTK